MDPATLHIIAITTLVLIYGFFSAAEVAVISLRRGRIDPLIDAGHKRARIIGKLHSMPDNFFAAVQIGAILSIALAAALGGANQVPMLYSWLLRHLPEFAGMPLLVASYLIFVLGFAIVALVFGELVPKAIGSSFALQVALAAAWPLHIFSLLVSWLTYTVTLISNLILRPFSDRTSFTQSRLLDDEIRNLLEEGVRTGELDHSEHEIIENILELHETSAREVMVPRVDIRAISSTLSEAELRKVVELYYSRLPVYNGDLDHIVGVLHIKDLMRSISRGGPLVLQGLLRPPYYVPESMKIGHILKEMQKRKIHMAIVVDEFGGTAGLLTMEDILEEIVGDIQEVTESPELDYITPHPDGSYLVFGSCPIYDFNEYFAIDLPESDSYTSIAGYILELTGRFPDIGEQIDSHGVQFELVKRVRQKMVQFRIRKLSAADLTEADSSGGNGRNESSNGTATS